jgi:hypothetical protein
VTVRQFLANVREARVHVLPNPGSCGDGLIHMGLRRLLMEFNLRTCELFYPQPAGGELLLAPFAGNLCGPYHSFVERLGAYVPHFQRICLLPGSVDPSAPEVAAFLRGLPSNATIFCRERYSDQLMRSLLPHERSIWIDHDLAFEADVSRWRRRGHGVLCTFRHDGESLGGPLPANNFDFPSLAGEWMGEFLLDVVSGFETIHTDRAHVAIAGALLEKDTHVYPTAYHKLRGIYEYSLRSKPNVHFHADRSRVPKTSTSADPRLDVWRERAHAEMAVRARDGFAL